MSEPVIHVSAVVLTRADGCILTVRKRGTQRFMLPGGKPEAGETPAQTAARECHEEIGLALDPDVLTFLGVFRAAAANESGHVVEGVTFVADSPASVRPAREIAEVRWLDPRGPLPADLAPMLEHHVLPALRLAQ